LVQKDLIMFNMFIFLIGFILLFCSFKVISGKNTLYNVLFLILVFAFSSILCLSFGLEYNALIFISIYVGAISILFIFVIMMLQIYSGYSLKSAFSTFNLLVLFVIFVVSCFYIESNYFAFSTNGIFDGFAADDFGYLDTISVFGFLIFKTYAVVFYLCSIVLFISLIGSVYILIDPRDMLVKDKAQKIYQQISRVNGFFKKK